MDETETVEREIDAELKALPELEAPATLASRVMGEIARRASAPWYRQSWQMWPPLAQVASILLMLACFGGVCLGAPELFRSAIFLRVHSEVAQFFGTLAALGRSVGDLAGGLCLAGRQLGNLVLVALFAAAAFGCAACIALTTLWVRLGLAPGRKPNL